MEVGAAKMDFLEVAVGGWVGFENYLGALTSGPCIALAVLLFPP